LKPPQSGVKDVRGEQVTHGFIPRTTFVIDKNGKIVAVFSSETDHIAADEHVKNHGNCKGVLVFAHMLNARFAYNPLFIL